jgi:hypothetical protein
MIIHRINGNCINLDKSLGLIIIQLRLDSLYGVSNLIKEIPPKTDYQRVVRQNLNDGVGKRVIAGNISIIHLLNNLQRHCYYLVSATSQKRFKQNGNRYFLVRYVFADHMNDNANFDFKEIRNEILSNLKRACVNTIWLGDVFLNPLYQENKVVEGMDTICIDLSLHKDIRRPVKGYKKVHVLHATTPKSYAKKVKTKTSFAFDPVFSNDMIEQMYACL